MQILKAAQNAAFFRILERKQIVNISENEFIIWDENYHQKPKSGVEGGEKKHH